MTGARHHIQLFFHEIFFVQAGLELQTSRSQPSEWLGLQVLATCSRLDLFSLQIT
jgi:hypothetical protein